MSDLWGLAPHVEAVEPEDPMSIFYDPKKLLRRIAPEKKIKRLVSSNATVKKAALTFVNDIPYLDKSSISRVALKTAKDYRARIKKGEAAAEILDDPKQLIQHVQNSVVYQVAQEIKSSYAGERYVWLPSDAEEPDPEHQLNYGKVFEVGVGEMPGDRYGCKCGMEILVKETKLELGGEDVNE